jgi:hypothetical protein
MYRITYYIARGIQRILYPIEMWAKETADRVDTIKPIIWYDRRLRWHRDIFYKPHGDCDHEAQYQKAIGWIK